MRLHLATPIILGVLMTISAQGAPPQDFDALWDFDKPAETEAKFRALLPSAEKSGNLDTTLQLRTQIARTQGLQRKFDEAHKTLDEVQRKLSDKTQVAEVRYYLERGRIFNSSKNQEAALPLFSNAFDLATARKLENLAVDAAHMVAIAEPSAEKQMQWNIKAMKIAETSSDPKAQKWLGSLYNNMGWTLHDSGKHADALGMFEKSLAFNQKQGKPPPIHQAKWAVARAYRSLKRTDDALKAQKALEAEILKAGGESDGYVYEELGELYLIKGEKAESKKYFALAYALLSKDEWLKFNETKRLERMKELAGI